MAENNGNIGNEQREVKFKTEVYEQLWTISDWMGIQQNEDTLLAHTFEFTVGKSPRVQTKWRMGFDLRPPEPHFSPFWQLIEAEGFPVGRGIDATLVWILLQDDYTAEITNTKKTVINVGEKVQSREALLLGADLSYWEVNLNHDGELMCKLELTIMEPVKPVPSSVELKMKRFHKTCGVQLGRNWASLLGDEATADLKIMTRDGNMLFAHKLILQAQCPVFDSMFRSDLSENKTGVVNVKDVNSKTMGILLHFFYTGELLPSWKDNDTVVEFTYAVAKYQLTNVLALLDDVLGSRDKEEATQTDMQLLELAVKLELKTAVQELMDRIRNTLGKVSKGEDFLALWGI